MHVVSGCRVAYECSLKAGEQGGEEEEEEGWEGGEENSLIIKHHVCSQRGMKAATRRRVT